jgi:hypothetical protein
MRLLAQESCVVGKAGFFSVAQPVNSLYDIIARGTAKDNTQG